eukprot:SAG11_NODE_13617_length_647_cov_0.996350_2_plen_173_part_00
MKIVHLQPHLKESAMDKRLDATRDLSVAACTKYNALPSERKTIPPSLQVFDTLIKQSKQKKKELPWATTPPWIPPHRVAPRCWGRPRRCTHHPAETRRAVVVHCGRPSAGLDPAVGALLLDEGEETVRVDARVVAQLPHEPALRRSRATHSGNTHRVPPKRSSRWRCSSRWR